MKSELCICTKALRQGRPSYLNITFAVLGERSRYGSSKGRATIISLVGGEGGSEFPELFDGNTFFQDKWLFSWHLGSWKRQKA